jgi:hypothetical protein
MKLTENQKEFLLEFFFSNEYYPSGWRNIATVLLEEGKCVVAGETCIWRGGIGNFIKTEKAKGFVGCINYVFDLPTFLSSAYFKEVHADYVKVLAERKLKAEELFNEISKL